jgi:hypothetical protein
MRHSLHSLGEQVAKVKKKTGVTGERNVKGKSAGGKRNGTKKAVRTQSKKRSTSRKRAAPKGAQPVKSVRVVVRSLDPLRKCGPKTTVQLLYRVDEQVDGRSTPHLVFFDRHGWYCEHGRSCPAVGHARKFNGQIARVS